MRRAAVVTAFAMGTLTAVFVGGFVVFAAAIAPREPAGLKPADGIVVLTGGASRIADGVQLLATGYGQRLLITGVNRSTSQEEIRRTLPQNEHYLDCCVDLGHRALNTFGNAIEAAEWTRDRQFRSLVVVTSAWHMPRALVELGRALPEVELVAYPVVTDRMLSARWWTDPQTVKLLLKEYLKYMMAQAKIRPAQAVAPKAPPASPTAPVAGAQASVAGKIPGADGKPE
ncbi:YdcF family protein [Xanthobacteraceae bacterium A53D]